MKRQKRRALLVTGLMLLLMLVLLLPVLFLVSTSFKCGDEIFSSNAFFPKRFTLENYFKVFGTTPFPTYVKNSLIIALTVTVCATAMACMAGYAIARYKRGRRFFSAYGKLLMLLQMFPLVLMLIPLYTTFQGLGLVGTRTSLILAYGTFSMPFAIWLLAGFFEGVPIELEESGVIDGCSRWQVFTRLVVPVSSPGIASAAIFTFINCWNEYMMANVFIKSDAVKPLPLGLATFILQFGSEWGSLMAASTMTIIPVALFLVFAQKYIVQGLTAGAVKG